MLIIFFSAIYYYADVTETVTKKILPSYDYFQFRPTQVH